MELLKAIGGIAWAVGLLTLLVEPAFGLAVLAVALLLSVRSVTKTRERRHREVLDAVRERQG